MCITFFYINSSKHNQGLKFVFVHNREEDFSRPTLPLSILEED